MVSAVVLGLNLASFWLLLKFICSDGVNFSCFKFLLLHVKICGGFCDGTWVKFSFSSH
ncbi:hypothetical protein VB002_07205 [Campylobacter concisus]